ncbi:Proteasome subunit beta type-7, partial [Araneus ventricosus]
VDKNINIDELVEEHIQELTTEEPTVFRCVSQPDLMEESWSEKEELILESKGKIVLMYPIRPDPVGSMGIRPDLTGLKLVPDCNPYLYQGHVSAALILGGVDLSGPSIYTIHPHGSSEKEQYSTMGSGSLAAMSVFEKGWKPDLKLDEAKQLARDAIAAGVFNDLGSGSNVDLCVITKAGAEMIRPYEVANEKGQIQGTYRYAPGTTAVLSSKSVPLEIVETITRSTRDASEEAMDTA